MPTIYSEGYSAIWEMWDYANSAWPLGPGWSPVDVGTISGVIAGTGLLGGGTIGPVTLDADTTFLQQRVSSICAAGSSIRVINQDGTVTCEVDALGDDIGGSGTLNFISKFTAAATVGDSGIFEDALGNVGIGTTAPGQQLQVGSGLISPDSQVVKLRVAGDEPLSCKGAAAFGHNGAAVILGELDGVANIGGHSARLDAWADLAINRDGGNVGIGTAAPNEQLEITGNFRLPKSTATAGIIYADQAPFIHNFGVGNFFAGVRAGNLTMTGAFNTAVGVDAFPANSSGGSNTAVGVQALFANTTGNFNTASGHSALRNNTSGFQNTAVGYSSLDGNTTGTNNTGVGVFADVTAGNLTNATAIGYAAQVDASNKIRLGNSSVSVIEGQVAYTFTSDVNQKENFQAVDGEETLEKISRLTLESWNYKGNDPQQFRHYGPTAQEFFAAFGHDGFGTVGTDTTINSGDMAGIMMIAIQALERRTAENAELKARIKLMKERLKALEAR